MEFEEVLRTFAHFFEREGIRYAVIGGLALQAWGHTRFTRDIDIVVDRAAREPTVAFAESLGYETLYVSEGYSNHLHADRTMGRVDFMYVDEATSARLFGEADVKAIVGTLTAPVPRPKHLLAMKAISMKNSPQRADRLARRPVPASVAGSRSPQRAGLLCEARAVGSVRCHRKTFLISRPFSRNR